MTSILRLARALRSDSGVALPTVFGLGLAMLMLVAGAMSITTSGLVKTNTDEDYSGALAAAYAGVEEYQSRLSNDATYQTYGNPASKFTKPDSPLTAQSTVVLPTGSATNKAFGLGPSGTWADIPGSTIDAGTGLSKPSGASFRYEINNADYADKGVLHLRSTGRVGNVTRTVAADLKQDGFIDYLWFTNYEQPDPQYIGVTATDADGKNICERYAYASPARDNTKTVANGGCGGFIQFGQNDTLAGPVRSNDRLQICGTTFGSTVSSSSTSTPIFATSSGTACAAYSPKPLTVTKVPVIDMPPTNSDMKRETRSDLTDVPRPGCLYTGPTVITFNSDATMTILSPWTKATQTTATSGSTPGVCGKVGNVSNGLGSPTGATIPVLERNLIFVQAVPSVGSADPNAPATAAMPSSNFTCTTSTGTDYTKVPAGWQYKNGLTGPVVAKFPADTETNPSGGVSGVGLDHYNCRGADVYVKGSVKAQMTIAADNNIYVIGDLKYTDAATDVLGLVGNNAIYVWNPVKYVSGSNCDGGGSCTFAALNGTGDRVINAALLSVKHTFQVQNYTRGARGTLTVVGAIAQKFRGSVGTAGGDGYDKDYKYDKRYRNIAPPKFLTPVSTTYGVTQVSSVPAAFTATGDKP